MKKVALITGCAKGIGRQIALNLAYDGYNIIATYNTSLDEINTLKVKIESLGIKFESYKVDLKNETEINEFTNIVSQKYDKIDVLVNNAAKTLDNTFALKTKAEFMEVLEVNLVAPFLLIQKLSNKLKGGIIINISSTDGINTYSPLSMDYSASKAGLINLTKSLALELTDTKVYALCPNWVNTESVKEMNPDYLNMELKRIGQLKLIEPSSVAQKVLEIIEGDLKSGTVIVMEG